MMIFNLRNSALIIAAIAFTGALSCAQSMRSDDAPIIPHSTIFTSTREVRALTLDQSGALWAATNGGVLRRDADGKWTKWTRADGLPSHEIQNVRVMKNLIYADTPRGVAFLPGKDWKTSAEKLKPPPPLKWRNQTVQTTPQGLRIHTSSTRSIAITTPGRGTHISALWPRGKTLLAASFSDNVYSWNGRIWTSLQLQLPTEARDITSLCEDAKSQTLWIGTRRAGVWCADLSTRTVKPSSSHDAEPFDHNVQNMASFDGRLWVSTLEDGQVSFDGKSWRHFSTPQISTVAPRHLVVFQNALYVRHGDGQVDKYDGKIWTKNVFSWLPRHKVFALSADDGRLVAVQWGGWSEWNGATWTHHFDVPQLQNTPIVSLLIDDEKLWLGTQNKGVIEYSKRVATVHDERNGLPDDWITCLEKIDNIIYAGTFVGGLARFDGKTWTTQRELKGENVTALAKAENGDLAIATRNGVWRRAPDGKMTKLKNLDSETQALLRSGGLLVGARTGINYRAMRDEQ